MFTTQSFDAIESDGIEGLSCAHSNTVPVQALKKKYWNVTVPFQLRSSEGMSYEHFPIPFLNFIKDRYWSIRIPRKFLPLITILTSEISLSK